MLNKSLQDRAINTKLFSYDHETSSLVAFDSDLYSYKNSFGQIYDDAADFGLAIRSQSGVVKTFYLVDQLRCQDGDIASWTYADIDPTSKLKVIIYND